MYSQLKALAISSVSYLSLQFVYVLLLSFLLYFLATLFLTSILLSISLLQMLHVIPLPSGSFWPSHLKKSEATSYLHSFLYLGWVLLEQVLRSIMA